MTTDKLVKLAALKRVESAAGQTRYKKSIGSVITGGGSVPAPKAKNKITAANDLPTNGGLTGAAAAEYQNVLKSIRSDLASGTYDSGIKKLRSAIKMLRSSSDGDQRTAFVLERALIRLERLVAGSVNK